MRRFAPLMTLALLLVASCSDSGSTPAGTGGEPSVSVEESTTTTAPQPRTTALTCDPLDERACLLPWPNDAFTVPDPTTTTGRRLAIAADSTPVNVDGTHIDVTDQNRADGFSPGSAILALVPGLDLEKSRVAPSTDIGASLDPDAPVVLLDTDTGERLAYWAELDAQAPEGDQVLMVRPAVALPEGHRIVVVLRNLLDADGNAIPATEAFRATLDRTTEPPERGADFAVILDDIASDGICLLYTSPSPRDLSTSRMPSSA